MTAGKQESETMIHGCDEKMVRGNAMGVMRIAVRGEDWRNGYGKEKKKR